MVLPGDCLLEMAGPDLGVCWATSALDLEERASVLNFLGFGPGPTFFSGCLAGRLGARFSAVCFTAVGGILALKILGLSCGAWLALLFVAGDPAGNIFEIKNCLR